MKPNRKMLAAGVVVLAAVIQGAALPAGWLAKVDPELIDALQSQNRAEFLIALDSRADLSIAEGAKTREAKGALVVQVLKAHAASSQAGLIQQLIDRGLDHRSFWIANVVSATGSLADLQAIAQRTDVEHVYRVKPELIDLPGGTAGTEGVAGAQVVNAVPSGVSRIGAPAVWALGFRGQGVVVGSHDTGVQWNHRALRKKYRGYNGESLAPSHDYNWRNAFPVDHFAACSNPGVPCDPNSHGTHTTGTMVGDNEAGEQIGMAPGAQWIACRSLYDNVAGLGFVPTYLDCMEFMLAPFPIGDPSRGDPAKAPDIVNNSWGCVEACAPPVLKDVNDATYAAGILQVVSAGNDDQQSLGLCSTVAFPLAVYDSSFTVGATNGTNDAMAFFSSRGPVLTDGSLRLKPNVVAPGTGTRSAIPATGNDPNAYGNKQGTSMAGPHVAGVAALVMSAEPRLKGRVADVRRLIERSAFTGVTGNEIDPRGCGGIPKTTVPNNMFGWGRVDALAAVNARPQLVTTLTAPGPTPVGSTVAVTLVVAQPATGKLDVTGAEVAVGMPAGLQYVSASEMPASVSADGSGTTLRFARAIVAPGTSWTLTLNLQALAVGTHALVTMAQGDQVSPRFGGGQVVVDTGDADGDGVRDGADNCPDVANADQADLDDDGSGDACDVSDDRDVAPEPFTFTARTGVATGVFVTSEPKTIAGLSHTAPVSIVNGQYSIDGGAFTGAPGAIASGQTLRVRHVSASQPDTVTLSSVSVGTHEATFSSRTTSVDSTPDPFGFVTRTGVVADTEVESNVITLTGFDAPVSVLAGPGSMYRVNGGGWLATAGTLNPGDTLQTKHTSAPTGLTYRKTYVKVGGITGYFTTRTQ